MTTEDVVSTRTSAHGARARRLKAGGAALVGALTLAACGVPDGYVDGYWDNGDPIYAPGKVALFDEDTVPICDSPWSGNGFESRARAYASNGGVVNLFLFEVFNEEPDPNEPLVGFESERDEERERTRRERMQGSLETLYQYTHPDFDAEFGVSEPADMEPIKDELADHLSEMDLDYAPVHSYVEIGDRWLETPDERFTVNRIPDVAGFIEENNINTTFDGLNYNYLRAQTSDGTVFMLTEDKETGERLLLSETEEPIALDESSEYFETYEVIVGDTGGEPSAIITVVNDQCPPSGGDPTARFWIYDYELLFPEEVEPIVLV